MYRRLYRLSNCLKTAQIQNFGRPCWNLGWEATKHLGSKSFDPSILGGFRLEGNWYESAGGCGLVVWNLNGSPQWGSMILVASFVDFQTTRSYQALIKTPLGFLQSRLEILLVRACGIQQPTSRIMITRGLCTTAKRQATTLSGKWWWLETELSKDTCEYSMMDNYNMTWATLLCRSTWCTHIIFRNKDVRQNDRGYWSDQEDEIHRCFKREISDARNRHCSLRNNILMWFAGFGVLV